MQIHRGEDNVEEVLSKGRGVRKRETMQNECEVIWFKSIVI